MMLVVQVVVYCSKVHHNDATLLSHTLSLLIYLESDAILTNSFWFGLGDKWTNFFSRALKLPWYNMKNSKMFHY